MRRLLAGLACSLMVVTVSANSAGQEPPDAFAVVRARGQGLLVFVDHCASCHGRSGHGDGPRVEELTVRPSDLTRLSERNGWIFPKESVARAIDGADRAHRTGDMPLWGEAFRLDAGVPDDAGVKQRIEALTLYVEFIQARRPRR